MFTNEILGALCPLPIWLQSRASEGSGDVLTSRIVSLGGHFRSFFCSSSTMILAVSWVSGLILGVFTACHASELYLLLMRRAVESPVSIVGSLACVTLPLLFTAFAVYISKPWLIYLICFAKACAFGCTAFSVFCLYGSAGWLVRFLFQFTDLCLAPVFLWFCFQGLRGAQALRSAIPAGAIACGIVICLDFNVVSPFLGKILG